MSRPSETPKREPIAVRTPGTFPKPLLIVAVVGFVAVAQG